MEVILKAKHFLNAPFNNGLKCPAAVALNEQYPGEPKWEMGVAMAWRNVWGSMPFIADKAYRQGDYQLDAQKAKSFGYTEEAIRTIVFKEGPVNDYIIAGT